MNAAENRAEGRSDYVEIETGARLLSRADLVRKFVVASDAEAGRAARPHLRMLTEGRCAALRGSIGGRVECAIYHLRPRPCRTVQPGDGDCLRARRENGL
jgi:Fe-S-cluster containining protein